VAAIARSYSGHSVAVGVYAGAATKAGDWYTGRVAPGDWSRGAPGDHTARDLASAAHPVGPARYCQRFRV